MLKEAFKKLKNNFFYLCLLEIIFLCINVIYFIELKKAILGYLTRLESFTPDIQSIQNATDQTLQKVQLEQVVNALGPSTQSMVFLIFILTPIIATAVWIIFQGLIWRKLQSKPLQLFIYFRQCTIATIIAILLSVIIMNINFIPITILLMILVYYFLTLTYAHQQEVSLKNVSQIFAYGLRNIHRLGPYTLLLALTSIALFILLGMAFMRYTLGVAVFSWPWYILYGFSIISLNLYLKAVISIKIHQK
jgi:hypothetical protein